MDLHGQAVSYPAALALLRGQAYDALENHGRAIRWYRQALKFDPFCYEAFQVSLYRSCHAHCMLHCHAAGICWVLQNLSTDCLARILPRTSGYIWQGDPSRLLSSTQQASPWGCYRPGLQGTPAAGQSQSPAASAAGEAESQQ